MPQASLLSDYDRARYRLAERNFPNHKFQLMPEYQAKQSKALKVLASVDLRRQSAGQELKS